jgi:hypothetical protein
MTGAPSEVGAIFLAEARRQLDGGLDKIRHCLGQLDEAQLWSRPGENRNTVGNLVLHLAGNLGQRFGSTVGGDPDRRDRAAVFAARGPMPRAAVLGRLETAGRRAGEVLDGLTPAQVGEPRSYPTSHGVAESTVLGVVVRSLLHLAGHTQEIIAMTRTLKGSDYRTFGRGDW